ncbi:hypothetical protein [Bosea sp. 124]|uniref:hypothetical protein n=1 Tax=Bosea sp. 124 TaxID=2135642 RepID=UPI0011B210E9|nr:hypothetical protein [Bosea sp. 124]
MSDQADQKRQEKATGAHANIQATTPASPKIRKHPTPRPFPTVSLEKALSIANAIKEKNAGNPWAPTQVAKALGIGEKSSSIDTLYRASNLYGLTSGTRGASAISIEKIGRDIVYAPSPDAVTNARRRAFLNVELFSKVLEYYKGNRLPEIEFLSNTLVSEFSLPKEFHGVFREIFLENCDFVQIGPNWGASSALEGTIERRFPTPSIPAVRTIAAEHNTDGKKCFVIMPFTERNPARPWTHYRVARSLRMRA